MPSKRKRKTRSTVLEESSKRQKVTHHVPINDSMVKSAVLGRIYPQVLSLREYLISKLPRNSKIRRKKIRDITKNKSDDSSLASFLDETLVGISRDVHASIAEQRAQWTTLTQRADESASTLTNLSGVGKFSQSEIVDFAIWQLFSRNHSTNKPPGHLLCQGFKRNFSAKDREIYSAIPGVSSTYPNTHVTAMKARPWPSVLTLWGNEGEKAMIDLIINCGIFIPIPDSQGVYSQLSGQPLGEMKAISSPTVILKYVKGDTFREGTSTTSRSPNEITFVRNRMLYARAALNAHGGVRFGLRHIHVLNRFQFTKPNTSQRRFKKHHPKDNVIHVMLYVFPRQFGLHNVFTSDVDSRQTVQAFQDYTLREDEISKNFADMPKLPRRLRGKAETLVMSMLQRHSMCSYKELLDHYCPVYQAKPMTLPMPSDRSSLGSGKFKTQLPMKIASAAGGQKSLSRAFTPLSLPQKSSIMDHASPTTCVAAFCKAVILKLIPHEFWGCEEDQLHNLRVIACNIDHFICSRRFESMTLHEVTQGLKISSIEWLGPVTKMSQSDTRKRWEIFHEFVYYVFDSILIPLIRSNFHVTESNVHRYRLFYFRHDVWKSLAEPALASLKLSMFEEVKLQKASTILDRSKLGFSQLRLLPKEKGIRPIMNLRRRATKKGTTFLGSSINSVLAPVYNVLTYEKSTKPDRLGASLFSVNDLYFRLKSFKAKLDDTKPLYFAKLDVQAAFDSIPQSAVVELMRSLATEDEYRISKHMEMKPGEDFRVNLASKPARKWIALAHAPDDLDTFDEALETGLASGRRNTVFVENIVSKFHETKDIFDLLEEHVKNNIVKIGKKFFRQKIGIPQGSVVSSHLCNYFYADLEQKVLGFLKSDESLLLRLIDDFLLITTNSAHAQRFLQIMHDGVPQYGVRVNPDKTLVNFEASINGKKVARAIGTKTFPYCGSYVDTKTLEIRKDRERTRDMALSDALTVEYSKNPGHTFHRKVLNAFKIQAHAMFLDTSFNSLSTVLFNIYTAFMETASKTWTYAKCLPVGKQPSANLLIKAIRDLSELAFVLTKSKGRNKKNVGYACAASKMQIEWLAINAYQRVLIKRQSKYLKVLAWLDERIMAMRQKEKKMCDRMKGVLGMKEFED